MSEGKNGSWQTARNIERIVLFVLTLIIGWAGNELLELGKASERQTSAIQHLKEKVDSELGHINRQLEALSDRDKNMSSRIRTLEVHTLRQPAQQ